MSTTDITNEWIDEHNANLATCKIPGCENEVAQKLGPYGGLCADHREERKAAKNGQVEKPTKAKREQTLVELATEIEETHNHLIALRGRMRARLDAL